MLVNLHVKNFALIDEAEIDLESGLNVLTGETGAGKSILIDALSAALGQRAGAEVIRKGADSAYVEMVFSVPEEDRKARLEALDVSTEYDCIVVSRRILPGRSVHKINDETVTLAKLKAVTECLLDIHGQHEHQSLLRTAKHLEVLDEFAGEAVTALKKQTAEAFRRYQDCKKELQNYNVSEEERLRRTDFLRYEIEELENAAVKSGERDELNDEFRRLSHFEKIERAVGNAMTEIDGGPASASDALVRAARELAGVASLSPEIEEMRAELAAAEDILSSLNRELRDFLDGSAYDEERLNAIGRRLDEIHRLESKYGDISGGRSDALEKRKAELARWENYEERFTEALDRQEEAEEKLKALYRELHREREAAVPRLEAEITKGLNELNFLSVNFKVELRDTHSYGAGGADEAEFLISLNPGEDPQPLGRVASGGELSRIMLAIKTILADKDDIPTVIFDEIDSGISGRTARMVGRKLKQIAAYRQVILITHLPQIAALADCHFGIEKWTDGSKTYTSVKKLDEESSIAELARLLDGGEFSDNVYRTAAELKHGGALL